jgi:hypothetical protein
METQIHLYGSRGGRSSIGADFFEYIPLSIHVHLPSPCMLHISPDQAIYYHILGLQLCSFRSEPEFAWLQSRVCLRLYLFDECISNMKVIKLYGKFKIFK